MRPVALPIVRVAFMLMALLLIPLSGAQPEPLEVLWTSADHAARVSDPFVAGDEGLVIARQDGQYRVVRFDLDGGWDVLATSDKRLEDPIATARGTFVVGPVDGARRLLQVSNGGLVPVFPDGSQTSPAVHGDTIAFVGHPEEVENVYIWTHGEPRRTSPNPSAQQSPALDDLYVAWTDARSATPLITPDSILQVASAHPNNIDIYAMHRPSGNVFPVAEEDAQQEFPEFASGHRLVYRSIEADGRKLFMRDLSGQGSPGRVPVAPEASQVGVFAVEGARVAFMDGRDALSTLHVWDLDTQAITGAAGNLSSVIDMTVAGPIAFVERITSEGSVVEAIRLPNPLSVRFDNVQLAGDERCFEAHATGAKAQVRAWTVPGEHPLDVAGDQIKGCVAGDDRIRVSDGMSMTPALAVVQSTSPAEAPGLAVWWVFGIAFLLVRRGR